MLSLEALDMLGGLSMISSVSSSLLGERHAIAIVVRTRVATAVCVLTRTSAYTTR
jgi:hypothetical protein